MNIGRTLVKMMLEKYSGYARKVLIIQLCTRLVIDRSKMEILKTNPTLKIAIAGSHRSSQSAI
jgi:hypothetical protein